MMADNLGYGDTGPFGSKLNRTANLDRMAREGRKSSVFTVPAGYAPQSGSINDWLLSSTRGIRLGA